MLCRPHSQPLHREWVSFIPLSEHHANKHWDLRLKEMISSIGLAAVQSCLWKTYQMHRLRLLWGFYHVSDQKHPTWAESQLSCFHLEGLLGCPLNYKSQPAAFYKSPDITSGREPQMATMWEGCCAFYAVCPVITPRTNVLYPISDTSFSDISSIAWFWGLCRLFTCEVSIGDSKVQAAQWWAVTVSNGSCSWR